MARWHFSIPIPVFLASIPNSLFRTPTPAAPAPPVTGYRHPIQSVEARREANRRVSRVLSDTDTGDLPPSPDEGLTIEARITGGLDRAALVFLKILENEERDPVTNALLVDAKTAALPAQKLGVTGGDALKLDGEDPFPTARFRQLNEEWLPKLMAAS